MILQIDSVVAGSRVSKAVGRWLTIAHFTKSNAPEVEDAAASLSRACGGIRMRVVNNHEIRELNDRGVFREQPVGEVAREILFPDSPRAPRANAAAGKGSER
jgi:hypothetical protein